MIAVPPELKNRPARLALLASLTAAILCMVSAVVRPEAFFPAYLAAYLFVLGISLGSLAMLMVHQLVGGHWGQLVRGVQEAAVGTLPLIGLWFLPILIGLPYLYPWANSAHAQEPLVVMRSPYMAPALFTARSLFYFICWIALALLLRHWAAAFEHDPRTARQVHLARLSAGGLVLYMLTASFAAMDWLMSRDTHWYSTVIGFLFVSGQALSGMAFSIVVLLRVVRRGPFEHATSSRDLIDLGNILLTLVILFAYMAFVQFLIQWYGDAQEDIRYYVPRMHGGWAWIGTGLIVFHFFVPLFVLLIRFNKRHRSVLNLICVLILFMRGVDNAWLAIPSLDGPRPDTWLVILNLLLSLIAIGGCWGAVFAWLLATRPFIPSRDPALFRSTP